MDVSSTVLKMVLVGSLAIPITLKETQNTIPMYMKVNGMLTRKKDMESIPTTTQTRKFSN